MGKVAKVSGGSKEEMAIENRIASLEGWDHSDNRKQATFAAFYILCFHCHILYFINKVISARRAID